MRILRISLLLVCAFGASMAHAIPVTWRAAGVVDETPPPFFFPFPVSAGDRVSFDYHFDNAAPCVLCETDQARYDDLLSSLLVRVNDAVLEIPLAMSSLYLANDRPIRDGFLDAFVLSFIGTDAEFQFGGTLALQNVLPTAPVPPLSSVDLAGLMAPPDPLAFPPSALPNISNNFFTFSISMDRGFNFISGELDAAGILSSASPDDGDDGVAVPEPTAALLMLSGLLGLWVTGTSRRRRSGMDCAS